MFWFVLLGLLVGLGYGLAQSTDRWHSALAGLIIALASAAVGGLIGLLFGLPKHVAPATAAPAPPAASASLQAAPPAVTQPAADTHLAYGGNTNLEQVSDWLTKILLGAGLTQIVHLPSAFEHLGNYLAPSISTDDAAVFATALVVFNLLAGFFYAFLGARILLPRALTDAETKVALAKVQLQKLEAAPATTGIGPRKYTTLRAARHEAIQLYERVEQLERYTPGATFSSDDYRRLVQQLVKVRRPVTALNLLNLAMNYHPDDASLPLAAGVVYGRELHQYEEAERCYYEVLHLDPDSPVAYYDLACNYARRWYHTRTSPTPKSREVAEFYLGQARALLARIKEVAEGQGATELAEAYSNVYKQAATDSVWREVDLLTTLRTQGLLPPERPTQGGAPQGGGS